MEAVSRAEILAVARMLCGDTRDEVPEAVRVTRCPRCQVIVFTDELPAGNDTHRCGGAV